MAATDDTSKIRTRLEQTIEEQRARLLQAHGVLTCLYEVLLYADGDDAVECAQAAQVAVIEPSVGRSRGLNGRESPDSVPRWWN